MSTEMFQWSSTVFMIKMTNQMLISVLFFWFLLTPRPRILNPHIIGFYYNVLSWVNLMITEENLINETK